MWDKQFCLGIVAIIVLYYLMTRTFSEGLTSLGNKSSIEHVKNMPDIQQMQLINEEIKRATQDMARESALHARLIPLHPVPEIKDKVNEKTTQYLKNISNYMQELERGGASSKMGIMGNFTNSTSKQSNSPFNKLNATVIAPSNYVFSGDSFKADVFVTAFDTTQDPEVLIYRNYDSEGNPIGEPEPISVEGGVGKYNVPTGKEGYFTWGGVIRVKSDGGVNEYPFMNTYQV